MRWRWRESASFAIRSKRRRIEQGRASVDRIRQVFAQPVRNVGVVRVAIVDEHPVAQPDRRSLLEFAAAVSKGPTVTMPHRSQTRPFRRGRADRDKRRRRRTRCRRPAGIVDPARPCARNRGGVAVATVVDDCAAGRHRDPFRHPCTLNQVFCVGPMVESPSPLRKVEYSYQCRVLPGRWRNPKGARLSGGASTCRRRPFDGSAPFKRLRDPKPIRVERLRRHRPSPRHAPARGPETFRRLKVIGVVLKTIACHRHLAMDVIGSNPKRIVVRMIGGALRGHCEALRRVQRRDISPLTALSETEDGSAISAQRPAFRARPCPCGRSYRIIAGN